MEICKGEALDLYIERPGRTNQNSFKIIHQVFIKKKTKKTVLIYYLNIR